MKANFEIIFTSILLASCTKAQRSGFDVFVPKLRISTAALLKTLGPSSENIQNLRLADQINILQPRVDDNVPFPCFLNNTRSEHRPTSVHALRPGDIDVIGAIGDSLIAGNGIVATHISQIAIQNRGISAAIGGQGTWRQFVTLPNILKEFNPQLYGYSLGDSFVNQPKSQFNVAEAFALSKDMTFMTSELVRRMKEDPHVNIKTDWKMITFLIGANDFCEQMCYLKHPEDIVENHRKDLLNVLRILRDNLPRTIVNLVLTPHIKLLRSITTVNRPPLCYITLNSLCPCFFGLRFQNQIQRFYEIIEKWQIVDMEVANQSEFDTEDFTVVAQPFLLGYRIPTKYGLTDYSSLSQDCFHLSQKEGAKAALSLWNNLLQPVGNKNAEPFPLFSFKCPISDNPYIFTRRNSKR